MKYLKLLIKLNLVLIVAFYVLVWGKSVLDSGNQKPCYEATLPSLQLCFPRDYFMFSNFPINTKEAYNWKTFYLPINDDIEGGNQLGLMIPVSNLPIVPFDYDDGNQGRVAIHLKPMYMSQEKRLTQFMEFRSDTVVKKDKNGVFIHCDYYDHERGNPDAKKYCLVKMDWDSNLKNPRIELSFSIAPQDFNHIQRNAGQVKTFLSQYVIRNKLQNN